MSEDFIVGVDEAGRGPLAGPVTAAAVLIPLDFLDKNSPPPSGARDSKRYTELQREEWFDYIDGNTDIEYEFSSTWVDVIERINIANAANLASTRAVKRLIQRSDLVGNEVEILLDGSLSLQSDQFRYEAIKKGDQKELSIQLASIVAKVKRDSAMRRIHRKYPEYNFRQHKGYGTEEHRKLVKKHGPCEYHRLTFLDS